jgi:hypothetical protein
MSASTRPPRWLALSPTMALCRTATTHYRHSGSTGRLGGCADAVPASEPIAQSTTLLRARTRKRRRHQARLARPTRTRQRPPARHRVPGHHSHRVAGPATRTGTGRGHHAGHRPVGLGHRRSDRLQRRWPVSGQVAWAECLLRGETNGLKPRVDTPSSNAFRSMHGSTPGK